jgi:hypothetical protein
MCVVDDHFLETSTYLTFSLSALDKCMLDYV